MILYDIDDDVAVIIIIITFVKLKADSKDSKCF